MSIDKERDKRLTLQSKANLRASIIAAFLSLSDSNPSTNETPIFGCQNDAWAAAFPPPLTPHSCIFRPLIIYQPVHWDHSSHTINFWKNNISLLLLQYSPTRSSMLARGSKMVGLGNRSFLVHAETGGLDLVDHP